AVSSQKQAARLCVEAALRRARCDCAGIYLLDRELGRFAAIYGHGLSETFRRRVLWIDLSSEYAHQIMTGAPLYRSNDQLPEPIRLLRQAEGLRASGLIPILDQGVVMACLMVASRSLDEIPPASRPALEAIAPLTGAVIRRILSEEEKQKLELQLAYAQKMEAIGTLAGGIAHEFNNMLYVILGNLNLALNKLDPDSPLREWLEAARKAAQSEADLVRQIVAFSRSDREERKSLMPHLIIEETLKMLEASLPASIQMRWELSPEAGPILGNPGQIQQALMHLCANAEHAMREKGGVLEIRLDRVDAREDSASLPGNLLPRTYARLQFRDTGAGMDRMVISRIFNPFFTTKTVNEGTGMGLSVVHGIVRKHEGLITVDSAVGKGSAFTLYFPIIEEAALSKAPETAILPQGKEHVLFVDDEPLIVSLARQMLTHLGYGVTAFTSSRQALESFRQAPDQFDLLIADPAMPEFDGSRLTKECLRIRPNFPVIWSAGFSQGVAEADARE
ncbi:MAG: ATP-binding protein, partial [Candidatus Sumerlaeota bacterium]|nr:ATP-binding protein [Candidatus Sumerlaeota bacterium]